ncbi:UTP--glucose-1-phosphate uridylyltransferase [Candidatus Dependentiae bacterium]
MFKKEVLCLSLFLIFSLAKPDNNKPKNAKNHVTKSVILAAGLGTRFLPFTKSIPKEMLPIIDKPAMHYIAKEGLDAGVTNFLMLTNNSKYAIESYFDFDKGLDAYLKEKNKIDMVSSIDNIIRAARFTYIRQLEPLGTGHAVSMAKHCIGKEYFAVILPDDLFFGGENVLEAMIAISKKEHASVIAVQEVPMEKVSSYGIVAVKKQLSSNVFEISQLVEKPATEDAPSNMAIIGRYILSHKIFDSIENIEPGKGGEL